MEILRKMNILGCVNFCVDSVRGHHYFCGSYLGLLKVKILNWNNILGYAKITNIFGVCLKGLVFFRVNSRFKSRLYAARKLEKTPESILFVTEMERFRPGSN